jgi:hypothetical protein
MAIAKPYDTAVSIRNFDATTGVPPTLGIRDRVGDAPAASDGIRGTLAALNNGVRGTLAAASEGVRDTLASLGEGARGTLAGLSNGVVVAIPDCRPR